MPTRIPFDSELSFRYVYEAPDVVTPSVPPFITKTESHLSPLPPFPVAVRVISPASMVMLESLEMQAEPLTSESSESHAAAPLFVMVIVGVDFSSLMVMSPSAVRALPDVAVAVIVSVPPAMFTYPVSSSSADTCMPSSPVPEMLSVPPFCSKCWLTLMPSLTALRMLIVPVSDFFSCTYSSAQYACFA